MPQKESSTSKTSKQMKLQTAPIIVEVKKKTDRTNSAGIFDAVKKRIDARSIENKSSKKATKAKIPSTDELVDAVQASINARKEVKKVDAITSYSMPTKKKLKDYKSIKEASEDTGISQGSIKDIANGNHPFNHKHLLIFAYTDKPLPKYWKKINLKTKIGDINPKRKKILDANKTDPIQ